MSAMPIAIIAVAPTVPAVKSGATVRPYRMMATLTIIRVRRRPRSASTAAIGIVAPKKSTPKS
jgi:hypothetical protein